MSDSIKISSGEGVLADTGAREEFCNGLGENFSVIAPAGVGKTTAIVSRIVNIAKSEEYREVLPKLVVVAYTNKAAEEMRERTQTLLAEQEVDVEVLQYFEQAFFGTIHSFCLELLEEYGPKSGMLFEFNLLTDHRETWLEFVRGKTAIKAYLAKDVAEKYFKYVDLNSILSLVSKININTELPKEFPPFPELNFDKILNFKPNGRNAEKVEEGKMVLEDWLDITKKLPDVIPQYELGGKDFKAVWKATFQPLRDWLEKVTVHYVVALSKEYLKFRLEEGKISYNDMISLTCRLLEDPEIRKEIRDEGYRVILDEAQDADKQQLRILTGIAQPVETEGLWLDDVDNSNEESIRKGHFCMVGDPQQSIFSSRADLSTYLRVHEALQGKRLAKGLTFCVTMRCPQVVVTKCNMTFANILKQKSATPEQVSFVPLQAKPGAGDGAVTKLKLDFSDEVKDTKDVTVKVEEEANLLGDWFSNYTLSDFGVSDFKEVAVLCPRNDWLSSVAAALRQRGVKCQVHSSKRVRGENIAFAWFSGLVHIMTDPEDSFEVAGVVREVYGVPDKDLAEFVQDNMEKCDEWDIVHPLQILRPTVVEEPKLVVDALNELHEIRKVAIEMPLDQAVEYVVKQTHLWERLSILPHQTEEVVWKFLEEQLLGATEFMLDGGHLLTYAQHLVKLYYEKEEEQEILDGHVQLYSCHKAKGLEWGVTIMPFLFRKIPFQALPYPRVIQLPNESLPRIALDKFSKNQYPNHLVMAELERLFYVAFTRTKNRLILVDDEELFEGSYSRGICSFGELVKDELVTLPEQEHLEERKEEVVVKKEELVDSEVGIYELDALFNEEMLEKARAVANDHIKRILPSQLAKAPYSTDKGDHGDFPGRNYGIWWHEMMEGLPYKDMGAWDKHFKERLEFCPVPEIGEQEIGLFVESELVTHMTEPDLIVRSEVPFIFPEGKTSIEGVIDLIIFDPNKNTYLVIDWKTERYKDLNIAAQAYQQQINTYTNIITKTFKTTAKGSLYFSQSGVLV